MTIEEAIPLSPLSTFRIGGTAAVFLRAREVADLREAERYLRDTGNPLAILGGGSNTLFGDDGFDGAVLKIEIPGIDIKEDNTGAIAVVGAGVPWDTFVAETIDKGLYGLENLSGIPGSVGASPVQNIGAYGREVGSLIEWVEAFDRVTMKVRRLSPVECQFGYRDSIWKHAVGSSLVISRVAFRLSRKGSPMIGYMDLQKYFAHVSQEPTLHDIRKAVLSIRAGKFPSAGNGASLGTAGSFFKNPVVSKERARALREMFPEVPIHPTATGEMKVSSAWLIDHGVGMKGYRKGRVRTFEQQPLVIVAEEGATAHEVIALSHDVADAVKRKTGIDLEPEVRFVGCAWKK